MIPQLQISKKTRANLYRMMLLPIPIKDEPSYIEKLYQKTSKEVIYEYDEIIA